MSDTLLSISVERSRLIRIGVSAPSGYCFRYGLYVFLLASVILTGCEMAQPKAEDTSDTTESELENRWIEETLSGMSLSELVSQMIIVGIPDAFDEFDPLAFEEMRRDIIDFGAGGIVFLRSEPLSQSVLVTDLQAEARIPLLVAQDMEWGAAMRVKQATRFPQAMGIGASGDPELARVAGVITATEARSLGVNFILAPVADVNSNPSNPIIGTRSFGDDPEQVSRYVSSFVKGVQETGLLATVKHFPGHGSTSSDSHLTLPLVAPERFQTELMDLRPFQSAIRANVGAVMTGHLAVAYPGDKTIVPATLSPAILQDILRKQLQFNGLVISDAMNMAGVGRPEEADSITVQAVRAGVDLLLMPKEAESTRDALIRAVREGALSERRIRESVRRILRAKASIGLSETPESRVSQVRSTLTDPSHRAFAKNLAHRSLVLLNDSEKLDRLQRAKSIAVIPIVDASSEGRIDELRHSLMRYHNGIEVLDPVSRRTEEEAISQITRKSRTNYDVVLIADLSSERRADSALLARVLDAINNDKQLVIILAMGSPYALQALPAGPNPIIVSFGSAGIVIDAAADVLFGRATVCGHLPVQISDAFPRGAGLCRHQSAPRPGLPEESGMSSMALRVIQNIVTEAIADSAFPGAALAVGREGILTSINGYGRYTYDSPVAVTPESLFDLASLTKVIATTTAIMLLYENDRIRLDDPVAQYLPAFGVAGKDGISIRQLLTHTGGLIPFRPFYRSAIVSRKRVIDEILGDSLIYEPGTQSRYTDFGPIVLALVVEKIAGMPFDEFAQSQIFEPLAMTSTGYRPVGRSTNSERVVPTEIDQYFRHRLIQGVVHDETAYVLGGVAGHAGLFSTLDDLSRFAFMMVSEGRIGDKQFLKPETIRLFTAATDPDGLHTRALGWDTRSPRGYSSAGSHFGRLAFGHTGFTGTSLWIDPDEKMFVILLTNRVYPSRDNSKHVPIRPAVADAAYKSIRTAPMSGF